MAYVFNPTREYHSTVCEGVTVVLRKMTEARRVKLQLELSVPNQKIRDILTQIKLQERADEAVRDFPAIMRLNEELNQVITRELNPAKIRWAVSKIKGLQLGDEEATVDNMMDWPSDLFEEILNVIDGGTALSESESKNSGSPTTSDAPEGGRTNDTGATSAD